MSHITVVGKSAACHMCAASLLHLYDGSDTTCRVRIHGRKVLLKSLFVVANQIIKATHQALEVQ
jgi:hypothetical protein